MSKRRIIIGVSGATGSNYAVQLLRRLQSLDEIEAHLVVSQAAALNLKIELSMSVREIEQHADVVHSNRDIGASIASGSFGADAMIIAPCSVKTLGSVATGICDNLIARAADVTLKERRRLVMLVRETPLHLVHLRNMVTITEMGGIIFPPVPAFYSALESIDDMVEQTVARVLGLVGIDVPDLRRWQGLSASLD